MGIDVKEILNYHGFTEHLGLISAFTHLREVYNGSFTKRRIIHTNSLT